MKAKDIMTPDPTFCRPETLLLDECCRLLEEHQIRRLLVVDDGGVCCGVISQADVARSASERQTAEVVREVSRQTSSAPQPSAR